MCARTEGGMDHSDTASISWQSHLLLMDTRRPLLPSMNTNSSTGSVTGPPRSSPVTSSDPGASKLRRLSLVARRDVRDEHIPLPSPLSSVSGPTSAPLGPVLATPSTPQDTSYTRPITPSPLSPPLARRSTQNRRGGILQGNAHSRASSISYSPARNLEDVISHHPGKEVEVEEKRQEAHTLADKHADLLRMIAMRERRVNELRQELSQQEKSLAQLRARWTSLIARDVIPPSPAVTPGPSPQPQTDTSRGSASAGSMSSTSSLPTVPDSTDDYEAEPAGGGIGSIFSAIAADETIQEGKRFWGQLMRTVTAAASGTVPEEDGGLDLSGLRTMLPPLPTFSISTPSMPSLATTPTPVPRPANESRLSHSRYPLPPLTQLVSNTQPQLVDLLTEDDDESKRRDAKVLSPKRHSGNKSSGSRGGYDISEPSEVREREESGQVRGATEDFGRLGW